MTVALVAMTFIVVVAPMSIVTADELENVDRIVHLPSQPTKVSFQQFSGYVTVDGKEGRALFYYFVEAESKAASKPLVLWFNGGI